MGFRATVLGHPSPPLMGVRRGSQLGWMQWKTRSEYLSWPANPVPWTALTEATGMGRYLNYPSWRTFTFPFEETSKIWLIKEYLKYHSVFVRVDCYNSTMWLMDPWGKWAICWCRKVFLSCQSRPALLTALTDIIKYFIVFFQKWNRKGIPWPVKTFPKENTHFLPEKKKKNSSLWDCVTEN